MNRRTLHPNTNGRRVFVYRNLHAPPGELVWSIRDCVTKVVIGHGGSGTTTPHFSIKNARFVVSAAGRARVLATKRKNVHAGVEGYLSLDNHRHSDLMAISYDPYKGPTFTCRETGRVVRTAPWVVFDLKGVWGNVDNSQAETN